MDSHLSAQSFIQFNTADHRMAANIRIRYNFREGNDLWIVYNEGLNTDRRRVEPPLLRTNDRTALIKYTRTFTL